MKRTKGFTLIELLVVVAIIGILATVVLASLNTARDKAKDAKAKAQLQTIHPTAILTYDTTDSYATVCTEASSMMGALPGVDGTDKGCNSTATAWAAWANISNDGTGSAGIWCVDSTGFTGLRTGSYAPATPACTN